MTDAVEGQVEAPAAGVGTPPEGTETPPAEKTWRDDLSEDLRGLPSLKDYKDVDSLAKSHDSLQKMMGTSFKRPEEGAPQEEWDTFYNKLGRPETPDGYNYERPEMPEGMDYDEDAEKAFIKGAHAKGYTKEQVEYALNLHNERVKDASIDHAASLQRQQVETQAALKKEWGKDYTTKLDMAQSAFAHFGTPEDVAYLDKSGKGNDPVILRMFANIGEKMIESTDITATNDDWLTAETAKKEAANIRSDKDHPLHEAYFDRKHKKHQEALDRMEQLSTIMSPGSQS